MGIGLEKVQQLFGHFLAAGITGMSAVASEISAIPNQSVTLARCRPVGPKIRPPQQQWRFHVAPFRIVIQVGVCIDLTLNQPAHDKGTFEGIRFGLSRPSAYPP